MRNDAKKHIKAFIDTLKNNSAHTCAMKSASANMRMGGCTAWARAMVTTAVTNANSVSGMNHVVQYALSRSPIIRMCDSNFVRFSLVRTLSVTGGDSGRSGPSKRSGRSGRSEARGARVGPIEGLRGAGPTGVSGTRGHGRRESVTDLWK